MVSQVRIPLQIIGNKEGSPRLIATFGIRSSKERINGCITGMIDTGSSENLILQKDLDILRISHPTTNDLKLFGVSGGNLKTHKIREVTLIFKTSEGTPYRVKPSIYAAIAKDPTQKTSSLPSILGMRFLTEAKFKLIVDPNGESYLETKDD